MFERMVILKDASLIPKYYHEDFVLYTNGQEMDYQTYLAFHEEYYQTAIEYQVAYDEQAFVEQGDRLAARVWITVTKPNEPTREIEVILIATYVEEKLHRLWELTYPDWSTLPQFEEKA